MSTKTEREILMSINQEEAIKELQNRGLTPVAIPDPNDHNKSLFFIENTVVWDKLFSALEEQMKIEISIGDSQELEEFYNSIKHKQWLKRIINANNPKLEWMDFETPEGVQKAMAIKVIPLMERGDKIPRIQENMNKWMYLVQAYLTQLLDRFEL